MLFDRGDAKKRKARATGCNTSCRTHLHDEHLRKGNCLYLHDKHYSYFYIFL